MRGFIIGSVLALILCVGSVAAQKPVIRPVSPHPNFSGIAATLKELVARKGASKRNTFLISGVRRENGREYAYAFWEEDKSIIILQLPIEKEGASYEWLYGRARVDLRTDVVSRREDIGGSSFLVDREWVNKTLKECAQGFRLSVVKPGV